MTEVPRVSMKEESKDGRPLGEVEEDQADTARARGGMPRESEAFDTELMNEIVREHESRNPTPNDEVSPKRTKTLLKQNENLNMNKEQSDLEEIMKSQADIEKEWKEIEEGI